MKVIQNLLMLCLLVLEIDPVAASVPLGGNRKGVGGSYDMYGCMHSNDYYVVNFAAYQIDPNRAKDGSPLPQAECTELPATGKTQLSIDLLDLDVRKKPVALKVLREDGQSIAELPMGVVKQGVLSVNVDFKTAGKYQAVISVDDADLHTAPEISALHIPISVALVTAESTAQKSLLPLFAVIGLIIAALAYAMPKLLKPEIGESTN